jgi:tetratricopeptide (TPR) repeat protein
MNEKCSKLLQIARLALVVMLLPATAAAAEIHSGLKARIDRCENAWDLLIRGHQNDYVFLQAQWSKERTACLGTGIYEFHWAVILQTRGQLRQSADYLRGVIAEGLPNDKSLRVLYLSTLFSEKFLKDRTNMKQLWAVNRKLQYFVRKYPRDSYILTEQSRELMVLQQYSEAFRAGREAAVLDPNDVLARMWLVISAARIHECRAAQPYIVPAIGMQKQLLANSDFMYAAASCYLELGSIPTAKNVLLSLAQRNSSVRLDPAYQRLARMVIAAEKVRGSPAQQ